MKTLNKIAFGFAITATAVLIQFSCGQNAASASPIQQAACDSVPVTGGPGVVTDCGNGCAEGNCGCQGRRGLLGRMGGRRVRCPDCDQNFPEEYCQVKVEKVDVEKTCFEVDYKTICIPKVVPPWKQKQRLSLGSRGCGQGGGCDGSCGGGCDGLPVAGGCDGTCGGARNCGGCAKRSPCKAAGCDPNAANLCCPSSQCAEARSVKILKKKKYKCPGCKCKWEVLKPELPAAPVVQPTAQPTVQPQPAQPATSQSAPQPYYQPQPASPPLNDYYGKSVRTRSVQIATRPMRPIQQMPSAATAKPFVQPSSQPSANRNSVTAAQFPKRRSVTIERISDQNTRSANSGSRTRR